MLFTRTRAISPEEAYRIMNLDSNHIILDVRTKEEYTQAHIAGAKLIPVDEISRRVESELPHKDATILVYCQSGMRASSAVKMLDRMGYTDVVSFGGIMNWPYGTVRG